jgi:4'-phosphopantetheinyl transferase
MRHSAITQTYHIIYSQPVAGVDLWQIPLRQPAPAQAQLAEALTPDEQERAGRFRFDRDRNAFQVARGAMRLLLGTYLDIAAAAVPLHYTAHGKPFLAEPYTPVKFNLSHAGDWALLAVSAGRELGVDIEQIRPLSDLDSLARRFFAPAEQADLRALPPEQRPRAFFTCWTRKEAFIKAVGEGLSRPLDQFEVTLRPGEPARLRRVAGDAGAVDRWSLHALPVPSGYVAALAAAQVAAPVAAQTAAAERPPD